MSVLKILIQFVKTGEFSSADYQSQTSTQVITLALKLCNTLLLCAC
jgi:hypothetical protein